jgi:tetratricopeptide (TPR) repeat protein
VEEVGGMRSILGMIATLTLLPACGSEEVREDPEWKVHSPQYSRDEIERWYEGQKPTGKGNFYKGNMAYEKGDYAAALEEYKAAVQIDPSQPSYWHNLGLTQYRLGQFGEAERSLRKTIELNGNYPDAHFNLALVLDRQGRVRDALRACQKALELNPLHVEASRLRAILEKKAERSE